LTPEQQLALVNQQIALASQATEVRSADGSFVKRDLTQLLVLKKQLESEIAAAASGGGDIICDPGVLRRVDRGA
jgi:hypothetical protein